MSQQEALQRGIAEALNTHAEPAEDDGLYRDGQLFRFPGPMGVGLEVFPGHGFVRVTTPGRRVLELHELGQPRIGEESVVFEGTRERLTLHADGRVRWDWAPEATAAPVRQPEVTGSTSDLPGQDSGPQKASEAVVPAREDVRNAGVGLPAGEVDQQTPPTTTAEAKEERVELTGRLGRVPTFRTSQKGTFIAKFPLAVHLEDGSTTWHTVLAFGPRAQKLEQRVTAGELPKGREVDVIGYMHSREQQGKNGKSRTVQEVHVAAVRAR
jgi:hypothetical protein